MAKAKVEDASGCLHEAKQPIAYFTGEEKDEEWLVVQCGDCGVFYYFHGYHVDIIS